MTETITFKKLCEDIEEIGATFGLVWDIYEAPMFGSWCKYKIVFRNDRLSKHTIFVYEIDKREWIDFQNNSTAYKFFIDFLIHKIETTLLPPIFSYEDLCYDLDRIADTLKVRVEVTPMRMYAFGKYIKIYFSDIKTDPALQYTYNLSAREWKDCQIHEQSYAKLLKYISERVSTYKNSILRKEGCLYHAQT